MSSAMVGYLERLWGLIRRKQLVGVDKAGNAYYRQSRKIDGALVEKRWVEFKTDPDPRIVPVEWTSWLTGRRKEAPTPEEMEALEAHRKLVKLKAAMLEKEEEKMRFRSKSLQQDVRTEGTNPPEMSMFIQQVAAREGVNFDGGDGMFANEFPDKTASVEHSSSRSCEGLKENDSCEADSRGKEQQGVVQPKGSENVYESWKWVPPN